MYSPGFNGSYSYHVDDKGRTKLPPAFIAGLGTEFVATRGLEGCIWLLPVAEWRSFLQQLETGGFGERNVRRLQRIFIGHSVIIQLDGQGRLAIPAVLRASAGIASEIIVAGVGSRVEIWARERWSEETEQIDATEMDELLRSSKLGAGG